MVSRGKGLLLPLLAFLSLGLFSGLGVSNCNNLTIKSITVTLTSPPALKLVKGVNGWTDCTQQMKSVLGGDECERMAGSTAQLELDFEFTQARIKVTGSCSDGSSFSCTGDVGLKDSSGNLAVKSNTELSCSPQIASGATPKFEAGVSVTLQLAEGITISGTCDGTDFSSAASISSSTILWRGKLVCSSVLNKVDSALKNFVENIGHFNNVKLVKAEYSQVNSNPGIKVTIQLDTVNLPEFSTLVAFAYANYCGGGGSCNVTSYKSTTFAIYDTATLGGRIFDKILHIDAGGDIRYVLKNVFTSLSANEVRRVIQANSCWLDVLSKLGLRDLKTACQKLDTYVKQNWINFFGVNPPDDIMNSQIYKCETNEEGVCTSCVLQVDNLPDYAKKDWPLAMQYKDIHDIAKVLSPQATLCDLDGAFYTFFDGFYGMIKSLLPGEVNKTVLPAILSTIAALVILFYIVAKHLVDVNFTNLKSINGENAVKLVIAIFITILIVNLLGGVFEKSNAFVLFGIFLLLIGSAMLWSESKEGQDNKTWGRFADFFIKMIPAIIIASIITSSKVVETLGGEQLMSHLVGKVRLIPRSVPILGWFSNFFIVDLRFVTVLGYSLAFYIFAKKIAESLNKTEGGGGQPPQPKPPSDKGKKDNG